MQQVDAISNALVTAADCRPLIKSLLLEELLRPNFVPHPLGFLRMLLGESNYGRLYLHCWPGHNRYLQAQELRIHQHSVPIISYVIAGALTNVTYDWLDDPAGRYQLFQQNRNPSGPRLTQTFRRGFVREVASTQIGAGLTYNTPETVFHESVIDWCRVVATACLFQGSSARTPLVVAPSSMVEPGEYLPPSVPESESQLLRRTILAAATLA